jgi:isopentenyldiphosphate isomerase
MSADEQVILVDEDDNVLGYKRRGDLVLADRWRISSVWIENPAGQALIAQRAATVKNDPNCWGPGCAGTVNKDEDYLSNALKELEEEIGVTGMALEPYIKVPYISARGNRRVCQWYKLTLDWPEERFRLQAEEVQAVRWIDKAELAAWLRAKPEEFVGIAPMWLEWFGLEG